MTRIAVIEKEKCNPIECGNYLCIRLCPVNRTGDECIIVGDDKKALIIEELCTGCGICPKRCPFEAIHIINLPEELKTDPIHRFDKNGFALYSLPTPIFGKVVGVLGVNGIGKSTAIKILAGVLKPNLGKDKSASYDELLDRFKGTESQNFFEQMKKGNIKVSYKPQQVELIPKSSNGKVRDLLKKVDEKNQLDKVVKDLEITNILDHDIKKISGGELQRVAIAATVLKQASLYIFDELTSYLDIKQRLKISKFIRSLVNEKTSVLVIEHDLIAFDYMIDLVHIMYGKKAAYGVVSHPKESKAGINAYLEGFLKDENIRFRDYKIRFQTSEQQKPKERPPLITWNKVKKDLETFRLETESGDIRKDEVVGVIGENGIGKTTFVKILADEIKKDSGEIDTKVKVSYKPQYIDSDSEELVINLLQDVIKKHTNDLINPLGIKGLILRKICNLSGGELQRVAIAKALGENCDLFLLDEPSAYLDVEQRLIVSKIIKNFIQIKAKSALVVDHDLLFY
ncbi:MAG: ribosome biogenesis/translation initiation ATPase RLI [Candidatus Woesearchaeota archaeon]